MRSRQIRFYTAIIFCAAALSSGAQEILAQETTTSARANPGEVICLAKPFADVPNVRAENKGKVFAIVAPAKMQPALQAKGFTVTDCAKARLAETTERSRFRDEICALASTGNEAVQRQLTRAYGERPAVLCAAAQVVAGRYVRDTRPGHLKSQG